MLTPIYIHSPKFLTMATISRIDPSVVSLEGRYLPLTYQRIDKLDSS